jgi:hypothetical protein
VDGNLDISGCPISVLPNGLTVKGNLVIANTAISQLPPGLKVTGGVLKIAGTRITVLPSDMQVEVMEWSEPLPYDEVKKMFYRMCLGEMKAHFWKKDDILVKHKKGPNGKDLLDANKKPIPVRDANGNTIPQTEEEREQSWIDFQPKLINYFMQDKKIESHAKVMLRRVAVPARGQDHE